MILLAAISCLFIGIVLLIFASRKTHLGPYIIVVHCIDEVESDVFKILKGFVKKIVIKSKTVSASSVELHYEVRLKGDDTAFINVLSRQNGVFDAVLVSYNGDYLG
jgi:hypothetical protein